MSFPDRGAAGCQGAQHLTPCCCRLPGCSARMSHASPPPPAVLQEEEEEEKPKPKKKTAAKGKGKGKK